MVDKNNLTTLAKRLRPLIKFAAQEVVGASNGVRLTILTFPGTLSISDNPLRIYDQLGVSQTITEIFLTVGTAPTGANLIVDVHKNGTTIFTTQANRPVIVAGTNTGLSVAIDIDEWADGEYLTAHIDQVGSTIKGSDLVVHIIHQGGGGIGAALANHDHSGDAGDGGAFDAANLISGASDGGDVLTSDGAGGSAWEAPAGGTPDASDVTYTPAVATDWDGDADPGNVDDALDQLAERTDDLEGATLPNHDHSGGAGDGGTFDVANLTSGASTDGQIPTSDGIGGIAWEDPPAGGTPDASDVTYTPAVNTDWDGDADPGNADEAFDQLAERVDDLETGGVGGGDSTLTDAYASRPAASNDGNLFLPNNGFVIERDTGAAYAPWGPIFPLTPPPAVSSLTWVNQETATAVETNGGIYMLAPAVSGDHIRMLVKAKSPPYTLTVGLIIHAHYTNYNQTGLGFRQSSDGKLVSFIWSGEGDQIKSQKFNSPTSYNSTDTQQTVAPYFGMLFLRIEDDNTNRKYWWSTDGQNFHLHHSEGRTTFLTADQAGLWVNSSSGTWPAGMTVLHWKET